MIDGIVRNFEEEEKRKETPSKIFLLECFKDISSYRDYH